MGKFHCQFAVLRKFWLLIWKNMLLRRRHWIITTFEVLLPTICAGILAYSNEKIFNRIEDSIGEGLGPLSEDSGGPSIKLIREKIYQPIYEDALIRNIWKNSLCFNPVPYAPSNKRTRAIMAEMESFLSWHGISCSFYPVKSEQGIEDLLVEYGIKKKEKTFAAAIIFQDGFPVSGNKKDVTISYKIRMKYTYSPFVTAKLSQPILPVDDTERLFPEEILDPYSPNGELQKTSYIDSGFLGLQVSLDQALIKILTGQSVPDKIAIQPFPIPTHVRREEEVTISYLFHSMVLPTFLVLGFIFIVPSIMLGVVNEKETGIRELLKMNGVPGWLQWIGWLVNSMIILILSVTIVIVLLFLDIISYGDPGVWYCILLLYVLSATSFCFFISSFFVRPILATIVGIIIWLVSYFPVFAMFELYAARVSFSHRLWACLSPNVAFYLAVKIMMTYERDGIGVQWSNIATPLSPGHYFSLGYIIMMFFANTALYMTLTVYLENVLATEFGVRRSFYYIFLPSTWGLNDLRCCWRKSKVAPQSSDQSDENLPPGFEAEPTGIPVGIQIQNLRKVFDRTKVAVDGINLKIYNGEIFVLLGHNGAGKTTTISMLTGSCAPSSGRAEINGLDISQHLEKVRKNLGLCPQHNMLFDKLTVEEHLNFFGRLKGLHGKDANFELQELMRKLQLWEKRNTLAKFLSGGQKRKLHLGIALIGHSGVAILDEISSGLDPEARRAIWDVLLEMRGKRTILLTTHFMEEADVLGDRIAIMASGKIKCCGTSSFLKKFYGSGYTLKLTLASVAQNKSLNASTLSLAAAVSFSPSSQTINVIIKNAQQNILSFVQQHVPDAFLKKTKSANASEVFVTLPTETATTAALTKLFSELPQEKARLDIKTVGMSHTTVDEVFLRVGELTDGAAVSEDENDDQTEVAVRVQRARFRILKMILVQFMALLLKKILYTYRKRKLVLGQVIVPVLLLIGAILSCNGFFAPSGHPQPVVITLDSYKQPVVPVFALGEKTYRDISAVVGRSAIRARPEKIGQTMLDILLKAANRSLDLYNNHYIMGAEALDQGEFKVLYSTVPNHAAPLAINLATNVLLRQLAPNANYKFQVTNHPMRTDVKLIIGSTKPEIDDIFYATVLFEVFMPIGLALLAATFIVLPMEEKLCKAKQLQMMAIINPVIYWGAAFLWDFFVVILVVCMMICCFPIFQGHEMYTSYGGGWVAFCILVVYGYCAIFFSYLISHFAQTVHGGFAFVTIIHIISGLIIGIVVCSLDMLLVFTPNSSTRYLLQFIGRLFPTYGAVISTTRYVESAIDNGRCNVLTPAIKKQICGNPLSITAVPSEWEFLECCGDICQPIVDAFMKMDQGRSQLNGQPECFKPKPYILWENVRESLNKTPIKVPGIGQEIMYMLLMSFVYQLLLIALEYRHCIFERIGLMWIRIRKRIPVRKVQTVADVPFVPEIRDEDVEEEAQRISEIIAQKTFDEDALVVHRLQKIYGGYAAVRQISFGVYQGECFGLLGVNGAGKTTTFRMLTGDETPSDGLVYAFAMSLKKDRTKYLSNVGYCPQFDGVIGVLTGRETLQLYCRLRGITGSNGDAEADKWLRKLGLSKNANVQCGKYSGGMKRRLCAAIAMIGDPQIILLDEPTSGVDPVSRRQFWKVLQSVRNSGQAIILTSHSMEECENLCSRLAIMVNGELQCIGGVQHLKSKFAQGYSLSVKTKHFISVDSEQFQTLHEEIRERFQPCIVKDKHNNFIQYEIQNVSLSWDFLFKSMEELKGIYELLIEDYSLSETTLEEVFLSFARKQYNDRHEDTRCSCCCK